jgi:nicotinate-nucleotide adenylyltransferase
MSTCEAILLSDMVLKSGQRVGIYIGTFDPIHDGHSRTIEQSIKQGNLDFLIVITNNAAIHKPNASPFNDRLQMVKSIYEHSPQVVVPDDESIGWPIGPAVIEQIKQKHGKNITLVQIYGDDVLKSIESQKSERATYKGISEWIVVARSDDSINKIDQIQSSLEREHPDLKIHVFKSTNPGKSSTKIKANLVKVNLGTKIKGLDQRVLAYIEQKGLYQVRNAIEQNLNSLCSSLYKKIK